MIKRHGWLTASWIACALAAGVPSQAQVERSGGGELQKFMQQYQQLAAEKTALQAQTVQMQKDLDAAKAELAAAKKERDALKVRAAAAGTEAASIAQLNSSREATEKNLEAYKQRMTEIIGRFRETATTLKDVEADRNTLRKELDTRNAAFDKCAEDNLQLFEIGNEVLNRYEHVGLFTKVSALEPFTRLTRTRIDNLVDEYRARALENRVQKRPTH